MNMRQALNTTLFTMLVVIIAMSTPFAHAASSSASNVTLPTVAGGDVVVSLINQNPDPASAGDPLEIRVGVQNLGQGTKQNLNVELIPSYPFTALSGTTLVQTIGSLGYQVDQNTQIMKFTIGVDPQATAGTYNLKVWSYGADRNTHSETTIPITIENRRNVQVIYVDKSVVVPGQVTPITFTINNVGKSTLNHLQFHWSTANNILLPVNGAADRYIDSLGNGESVNITYDVIASTNANPDLYGLNLILSYDNPINGGQTEFATVAGVYVGGWTNFSVSFDSNNGGVMAFNVANIGSNPASAVTVSIPDQEGWHVTGSKTSVIGSLAKGDYTVASFTLAGTSKQPLKVKVDYTDTMGNRRVENYNVDINTAGNATGLFARNGAAGAGRTTSTTSVSTIVIEVVIAIAAIVGLVAAFNAYRKRPVKKK